jgi:leucyl-tRNA synthetase
MYIGGAEHSVLHLLYARFVTMALHDMKLLHFEEPFTQFRAHGLITKDGAKMSKSKGNVVTPDDYFGKFGADVMRMYLAFMAPLDEGGDFRDEGILGLERFLKRVWNLTTKYTSLPPPSKEGGMKGGGELQRTIHRTIKKVTEDIESLHYNTAISALMILLNEMEAHLGWLEQKTLEQFIKLLAPFAPFMTEEIWQNMATSPADAKAMAGKKGLCLPAGRQTAKGKFKSIHREPWPEYDSQLIIEDTFTLVVQVNGKVRDTVEGVAVNISEEEARAVALAREKVQAHFGGKTPQRVVYIRGRIVNIVV